MYSADSRTRGLMHACSVSAKNKVLQLWIFPVLVRASCWVRASRPWVRSAIPQSTEYIRPTDSVERPTIHSVPSPSGRSGSTLNGGAAHHKSCAYFSPPTLYCCARLWSGTLSNAFWRSKNGTYLGTTIKSLVPVVRADRWCSCILWDMHEHFQKL